MNRLEAFISQLDGLVVFMAASRREVFDVVKNQFPCGGNSSSYHLSSEKTKSRVQLTFNNFKKRRPL